jgi:hypothetical protein
LCHSHSPRTGQALREKAGASRVFALLNSASDKNEPTRLFSVSPTNCSASAAGSKGVLSQGPAGEDTDYLAIFARQQWNDKWGTFERYINADYDGYDDDGTNWTFGVDYQYTPAVLFELAYDSIDFGGGDDDHMFRFKTFVTF